MASSPATGYASIWSAGYGTESGLGVSGLRPPGLARNGSQPPMDRIPGGANRLTFGRVPNVI
jgi:hypothetical protein